MELINHGEITVRHNKIHGKAKFPSYKKVPDLKSYSGIAMFRGSLYKEKARDKWKLFRELISYYIKCIHLEEGSTAKVWQNTLGEQFIFLSDAGLWYPRDNVLWRKLIPFAEISGPIRDLWRNSESTTLMLGYPVNAIAGKNGDILLYPVFCHVLDHRISPAGLEVKARLTRPFVNAEWLDHTFSRSSEKRTFLEACGMYASQNGDDCAGGDEIAPDFSLLAQILSSADERHVREPLNPCCLSDRPLDASCRSGIYNRAVIVASRSSPYSRSLITELETIARAPDMVLDKTALSYFFADGPREETVCRPASGAVVAEQSLTGTQRRAVASLLELPLTTIQGPPGTGKSQVVSSTVLNARLRGQSVLISSYNHKAIDAVMARLTSPTGEVLVVRCNAKEDPNLSFGMQNAIKAMLAMPCGDDTDGEHLESFRRLLKMRGEKSLEADDVERCGKELGDLGEELASQLSAFPWLSRLTDRDLGDLALYREGARLARECADETPLRRFFLRGNIGALLNLRRAGRTLHRHCAEVPMYSWRADMRPLVGAFEAASRVLELKRGIRERESRLKNMPALENLSREVAQLGGLVKNQLSAVRKHDAARRAKLPLEVDKTQLKGLERAMSTVKSALASSDIVKLLYEELPQSLPAVLRCFPCWAVSSLSVRRYIPLVPGLFDLVLIDEASQSNIPSAIPLLFRARRAGIIGDPWQLRFVSRMTSDREALLQRELNMSSLADLRFTFAENSLYDLASGSRFAEPFLLDCTFRSAGDIAAYSNRLFYDGRLQVGTDVEGLHPPAGATGAVEWREVQGEIHRGSGQRSCWCREEVEQVVQLVKHLLLTARFKGSIGIVTPFKEQAQRIEDSLEVAGIDHALLRQAGVHADTAHGFQGDERDVMIFSLCAGNDLTPGALHFLRENPNLFNVAVSRARAMLYLVGNREWAKSCGIDHIELLATPAELRPHPPRKTEWYPYESPYEKLLAEALQKEGLQPLPQVQAGYRRLDLALRDPAFPECRLDIEVDGACHRDAEGHRKSDDLWRTIELEAVGWRVIRFWTYQLREDLPGCVARVQDVWNEMREQNRSKAEE
ncbi:AAA domain-containing protein [Desulfovibrio sp. ZJ200]|uniref:AAA domain-containing protein n=1 Tax=Desulfovibrio sp. ZJ200 TaxID=2709792 RepID=UPI00197CF2CD|nr:AAA domain-containing protein [Desulfovibrio sp. ZJ200]